MKTKLIASLAHKMKRTKKQDDQLLKCFDDSPSDLVFWSFRYFLGRTSIHTGCFARDLAKAWPHIDPLIQFSIKRELDDEFERDDDARQRKSEYKPLGRDCDRASWQLVRDAYTLNK
jgi:hypothetical protein